MKNLPRFMGTTSLHQMKLAALIAAAPIACLLAGCNSLDNPLRGLFANTGRDGRVYNAATGQYEWPDANTQPRRPKRTAQIASEIRPEATPAASKNGNGRYFDPQKGRFVDEDDAPSEPNKRPKATPLPARAQITPKPGGEKSSGVYNMETGKFDWAPSGMPAEGNAKSQ